VEKVLAFLLISAEELEVQPEGAEVGEDVVVFPARYREWRDEVRQKIVSASSDFNCQAI
jgi:hypothetical protein